MSTTHIHSVRIIDPASGRDEVGDIYLSNGIIVPTLPDNAEVVDGTGLVAAPGFWDIHVHLREPGGEEAETIESGSRAAAHGGFTTIVAMPNTRPALDTPELIADVIEKGRQAGHARVMTTSCITVGREGKELAPLKELAAAGAIAFTDDGCTVMDDNLMRAAMETARELDRALMDHAQDGILESQGVMHQGEFSETFGLPGIPSIAEERIVRRDAELAVETGCRVHIQHITARESVPILQWAKGEGARFTGELSPHHMALCDADIVEGDAHYKMNPPLRSAADRDALTKALVTGDIDIFATDHAPHSAAAKARGFLNGPFGVLGLETAIGITYSGLVQAGRLSLMDWVRRWTTRPAKILGLDSPTLQPGQRADLVLLDLETKWTVDAEDSFSRSRNTPFHGRPVVGRAVRTWLEGKTTWQAR